MKKKIYYKYFVIQIISINLVLLLSVLVQVSNAKNLINIKGLFKKYNESVVTILSFDSNSQPLGIGSGFFVGNKNTIVTNYHVIENAFYIKIKLSTEKIINVTQLSGVDIDHDIVLLNSKIDGKIIPLSDITPEIGDDIIAIGNPRGFERSLSKGIVSGIRNEKGSVYYQITASISPGSSGGPIINKNGKVIGVSTFFIMGGQNLNFSVPAAYIHKALKQKKVLNIHDISKENNKNESIFTKFDESVKVVEPFISGLGNIEASILNNNNYPIQNIKIIIKYFSSNNPVHFRLYNIKDIVPPNFATRFKRSDSMLSDHGYDYSSKGKWNCVTSVYDYDIIEKNIDRTTLKIYPDFQ